jgi:4-phosphopantoate--beta-alanine ligase
MTRISPKHPRYRSLITRARLAELTRTGLVAPEGLIAHGRGEAFDYLLGERTSPSARAAVRLAARLLVEARTPVLSVNGNVAALAAPEVAALQRALPPLRVEVNLFHRTPRRVKLVTDRLRRAGVRDVLGAGRTHRIPGLPSDRAWVDPRGVLLADVCLIPLEDGDRTEALQRIGKKVIAIDLNPLSRTAERADLTIVDELTRALALLATEVRRARARGRSGRARPVPNARFLAAARRAIAERLSSEATAPPRTPSARAGSAPRPRGGRGRPSGRTR